MAARDEVLKSRLQPAAIDIVKSAGGYQLAIQAGGSPAVLDRYSRELSRMRVVEGADEEDAVARHSRSDAAVSPDARKWRGAACFLRAVRCRPGAGGAAGAGIGSRGLGRLLWLLRAGRGFAAFRRWAPAWWSSRRPIFARKPVSKYDLWPQPGNDFAMMKKIKEMFDPQGLLNRGRLYGRI